MSKEQTGIKLLSIKTKSLEQLDVEPLLRNGNANHCKSNFVKLNKSKSVYLSEDNKQHDFDSDNDNDDNNDHNESTVRFLTIEKSPNGACGFHLTRTKWDPYPWVSAVDEFTPAAKTDLKAGDCVLEVNGCDVLGLRITEIAKLVKSSQQKVTLLLWSTNCNTNCHEESLCAAPMPRTLQRLSLVVQSVLSLIECPVCRDTITPPAMQCQNGHLLCVNCRIRAEKCPVCRDRYYPRPALIAEQLQMAIASSFNLCRNEDKVRQKIFGRHKRQKQMVKTTLQQLQQQQQQQQEHHKSLKEETEPQTFVFEKETDCVESTKCHHRLLTKLLTKKAYSLENLIINGHNNITTTTTTTDDCLKPFTVDIPKGENKNSLKVFTKVTNQLNDFTRIAGRNHYLLSAPNYEYKYSFNEQMNSIDNLMWNTRINSKPCCQQMVDNKMQYFSMSTNDLTKPPLCLFDATAINKRPCSSKRVQVCETPYATIPRAIKPKEKNGERTGNQNACQYAKEKATNFLKSTSSSMTCLNIK